MLPLQHMTTATVSLMNPAKPCNAVPRHLLVLDFLLILILYFIILIFLLPSSSSSSPYNPHTPNPKAQIVAPISFSLFFST